MKKQLILATLLLVLSSCGTTEKSSADGSSEGNSTSQGEVLITYGNPITGADGVAMRQLVADFNEAYTGQIKVTETFTPETEYYQALSLSIPMKRAFDVALIHSYKIPNFAIKDYLTPLDDLITDNGIDIKREDYLPDVFDAMKYNDQLYAVPLDIHTVVLYYNKDLLDQYYDGHVPTNRAELIAAASSMPNTPSGGWGLPLSTAWPSEYIYTTALYQNGGTEVDSEGNPAYNTAAGLAALKSVTDLIHQYHLSPLNVGVDSDLMTFNQGKAMFHINGDWMLNSVLDSGVNFGVASLSNMFVDTPTAVSDEIASRSHSFILPNGRGNAAKQKASLTFIKYMTEHASLWAEKGGHVPASNIARATPEYAALPYHSHYGDVNSFTLNAPSPYYYEAYSPVFSRLTTALSRSDYDGSSLLQEAYEEGIELVAEARANE
ncbi:MAG TPA: extracellular solute-binding protein [Bacilli bacterium]|nr:extracellular solute-binding protein [Bacilli bacterium]